MLSKTGKQEIVVFANGIFDVLHPGHIAILKFAKAQGDRLVVGINSDRATKLYKGPERPFNNEQDRKKALEQFEFVDEVVIFDDTKTLPLIEALQPNVVVKGAEWTPEEIRLIDRIPDHIKVVICPLVMETSEKKYSSTTLIEKLRSKKGAE